MDESAREEKKVLKKEIYHPFVADRMWDKEEELPKISGFTIGKEYPVYEEKQVTGVPTIYYPASFLYVTEDDNGKPRTVPCFYFKSKVIMKYEDEYLEDTHPEFIKDYLVLRSDKENEYSSGIPYAVVHFQEMLKEAEEFKFLAGVQGSPNELLDKVLKLEKQMESMCKAIISLKELATRTYPTERKER
jgi:hypothetical protein